MQRIWQQPQLPTYQFCWTTSATTEANWSSIDRTSKVKTNSRKEHRTRSIDEVAITPAQHKELGKRIKLNALNLRRQFVKVDQILRQRGQLNFHLEVPQNSAVDFHPFQAEWLELAYLGKGVLRLNHQKQTVSVRKMPPRHLRNDTYHLLFQFFSHIW